MRHPILDTIPGTGEARNFHLDEEIEDLDHRLADEKRKAGISKVYSVLLDVFELASSGKVLVPLVGRSKK